MPRPSIYEADVYSISYTCSIADWLSVGLCSLHRIGCHNPAVRQISQACSWSDEDNITPLFSIGPAVFYVEGLMKALHTGCVIINMLLSFSILVLTSKPEDIADEMERHGFSPRFSYVISSVFSIIPQMMSTMSTITDAQKSRGMETEGSLSKRMKAFIPLITPVVTSSLINTRERAIALEVRGFSSAKKRTFLNPWKKHRGDAAMTIIMLITVIATAIWRFATWLL